jgi:extracellular elastinolytic metalloproteinase
MVFPSNLGQIVSVVDYYNKASYNAVALPASSPLSGFTKVVNPSDKTASPFGWNSLGTGAYTDTRGNNVDVKMGGILGWVAYRPQSTGDLDFDSNWKSEEAPDSESNKKASSVNLFYLVNSIHDISYKVTKNKLSMVSTKPQGTSSTTIMAAVAKAAIKLLQTPSHQGE